MTIIDFCGLVHSVAYDTYKLNRLKDVFDGAHIILQFIYWLLQLQKKYVLFLNNSHSNTQKLRPNQTNCVVQVTLPTLFNRAA